MKRFPSMMFLFSVFFSSSLAFADTSTREAESTQQYHVAAEKGDSVSQYNLATQYEMGRDVSQDPREAFKWYQKSAIGGCYDAMERLGTAYEKGELGQIHDRKQALYWYQKAENTLTTVSANPSASAVAFSSNQGNIPEYRYDNNPIKLTGILVTTNTHFAGKMTLFPAIQLAHPIKILENPDDESTRTVIISRIQLALNNTGYSFYKKHKDESIVIECQLFPMTTAHHFTPVLCDAEKMQLK